MPERTPDRGAATAGAALALAAIAFCALMPVLAIVGVGAVAAGGTNRPGPGTAEPSSGAIADVPVELIAGYITAAQRCDGLSWTALAAVAKLDTDHGRRVGPPGAIGSPISFTPAQWQLVATDGDEDGQAQADSRDDVLASAAAEFCPAGTTRGTPEDLLSRHRSDPSYVQAAITWSRRYAGVVLAYTPSGYALPVDPGALKTTDMLTHPHHDYPAIDLALAVGAPLQAITSGRILAAARESGSCGGTIVLVGDDGASYTYCHLSALTVAAGDRVAAGQLVGASGGQPGTPGAGRSTGPHLHFQVFAGGRLRCPQPLLQAIAIGQRTVVADLPMRGCIS